jgi:outer membrane protein assembly factor BamB
MPTDWEAKTKANVKWVARLGSRAYGGPVVAGGKVFVGTNNEAPRNPRDTDKNKRPVDKGNVMCFRESDGTFLWQAVHDKLPSGQVNDWPKEGVCSTPVVEGNRIYYVSNRCDVVCLDVEGLHDGNQGVTDEKYKDKTDADFIWTYDMMKELNVFPHNMAACAPLIVGDLIFVVTANGVDEGHTNIPSPEAPSFIAVNKKTGKLVWKDNSPGRNIMHGQWSNPTYAKVNGTEMIIFPGGDGWLRAFDPPTGKLLWKFDCNPKWAVYKLGGAGTRSDFIATPVIYDNKCYIGTGQDPEHYEGVAYFWCIDLAKAIEKGKTNKDNDVSPVNDNFDPKAPVNKDSALAWVYGGPVPKEKIPEVKRDYFFGRTMSTASIHDGIVYVSELAGYLHCFDAKTGQKYWQHDLKSAVWGSTYWVDGKVYLGNEDGDIVILQAGRQKKVLATITMGSAVYGTPVPAHNTLFVMNRNQLYALAEGGK